MSFKEEMVAVEQLNELLYKKYQRKDGSMQLSLSITIVDVFCSISLVFFEQDIEIPLYNSENNDRIFYEKSNKYESMYKHLQRRFREVKHLLNSVKM